MTGAFFLEPVDTWSFRDGRPFEVGEAFEARSLFPPSPWTTLGCVRTVLLRKHCPEPAQYAGRGANACRRCGGGPCAAEPVIGPAGEAAPFRLGPPLLARRQTDGGAEVFYPGPADLVCQRQGEDRFRMLAPVVLPAGASGSLERDGLRPIGAVGPGRFHPGPRWLPHDQLTAYLHGEAPRAGPCSDDDCSARWPAGPSPSAPGVHGEPRIGVGIDPMTRSTRQGQLYLRDVVRLDEGGGLAIRTSQVLDLDGAIGRLGGDGRMVAFRRMSMPADPSPPESFPSSRLRVYLASPTWFEGGWRPRWIDHMTLTGAPPGTTARLRLVGAAIAEALPLGGWDLKHQRPREMRRLVGSGSVYFFEVVSGGTDTIVHGLHAQAFCDDVSMAMAGFGLAFVGSY